MRLSLAVILMAAHLLGGCSVYMATTGEDKRDLGILNPGISRDLVLAEFGTPVSSVRETVPATEAEGVRTSTKTLAVASLGEGLPATRLDYYDIFRFKQGRSGGSNAGRAALYGTAAVLTLGLSEVVTTPLEMAVGDAGEITLRTTYDRGSTLVHAQILDGETWLSLADYQEVMRQREAAAAAERKAAGE